MSDQPPSSSERAAFWLAQSELFSHVDGSAIDELASDLDLVHLEAGATLIREGDPADAMYVVIGGRLHVVVAEPDGTERLLGEVGNGESVGEMALISDEARSATVRAARDTELIRITRAVFEKLVARRSGALLDTARVIAARLTNVMHQSGLESRLQTLALVPLHERVAGNDFLDRLSESLESHGSVLRVDRRRFDVELGPGAADQIGGADQRSIAAWHSAQEAAHRFVLYLADPAPTAWTRHCAGQADRIVLICGATGSPGLTPLEHALTDDVEGRSRASQELVVLHQSGSAPPRGTERWLASRKVVRHTHVALDRSETFARLGRLLAGRGVGVVLGGGGARGFAHLGVLRALDEAQVPIDVIGGVSVGAMVAAQYAMGYRYDDMIRMNREGIAEGHLTRDMTLPLFSLSSGRRFKRALLDFYGSTMIEDLWLPFFALSCNLSTAETVTHRHGKVRESVYASNAVPGMLPPAVAGGDLLVDAGIVNNEPGDVMKSICGGPVVVVSVSPQKELNIDASRDEFPSPWSMLWQRANPFRPMPKLPGISSVMMRSMTVSSRQKSIDVEQKADYHLRPPIDQYRIDDYSRIEKIAEVGHVYAKQRIPAWPMVGEA